MNTTEIGTYIREPQQLNASHVDDFKKLCEDHPYSGLLHVLYLKALGNAKALDFEQNLKQYAIKIPNRELLYYLIHDDTDHSKNEEIDVEEPLTEAPLHIEAHEKTDEASTIPILEDAEINKEENTKITHKASISEQLADLATEDTEAMELSNVAPDISTEQPDQTTYSLEDVSWLDNTITFDGFSAAIVEDEEQQEIQKPNLSKKDEEKEKSTISQYVTVYDDIEKSPSGGHIPEKESKHTFYDWLNAASAPKQGNHPKETSSPISDSEQIEQKSTTTISVKLKEEENSKETSPAATTAIINEKTKALVDKFIETEPKISRPKAEFFSPVKSAKESVREDGIPVSETLAKIYELQGNFPKAIEVLEKLCHLLPSKTSELENKIESIKLKMNN